MVRLILFGVLSVPVVIISRRTLFSVRSHGFYRFLGWESILWLFASNYRSWFTDPFSATQIISWLLLAASGYLVIVGAIHLKKFGKQGETVESREDRELYAIEKTSALVDRGIYRYIRHPLYTSLICLAWGIWFKDPAPLQFPFAFFATVCLWITARFDEKECIEYFGAVYREYMKRSKRFIPFIY